MPPPQWGQKPSRHRAGFSSSGVGPWEGPGPGLDFPPDPGLPCGSLWGLGAPPRCRRKQERGPGHAAASSCSAGLHAGLMHQRAGGGAGVGRRGGLGLQADSGAGGTGRRGSRCSRASTRSRHTCSAPSPLPHDGPPAWLVPQQPGPRAQPAAAPAGGVCGGGSPSSRCHPSPGLRAEESGSPTHEPRLSL